MLSWGCGTLTQHTISQTMLHNKSNRLYPAPLPSVVLPKISSQTDIGVEIVQSSVRVRHCHVIKNCAATDHETSLDFSSLGRQKNHPFQLRSEDADWLHFMSHLEYIYILNQDLLKFYKDPISRSPLVVAQRARDGFLHFTQ